MNGSGLIHFDEGANDRRIAFAAGDGFELRFVKLNQISAVEVWFDLFDVQGIDDILSVYP